MNRRIVALSLALCALAGIGPVCQFAYSEDPAKSRVAVLEFSNETGDLAFDEVANAVSGSFSLILRQLKRYEVVSRPRDGIEFNDGALSSLADEINVDYVLYGMVRKVSADALTLTVSLHDRQSRKTVYTESSPPMGLFDVFSGTDAIVDSVLERLVGSRIRYASLAIDSNDSFVVRVEGEVVNVAQGGEPVRIVSGTHEISLVRADSAVAPIRFDYYLAEGARYTLLPAPQEGGSNVIVMESLPGGSDSATIAFTGIPKPLSSCLDGNEILFPNEAREVSPGVHVLTVKTGPTERAISAVLSSGTKNGLTWVYSDSIRAKVSFNKAKAGWVGVDPVFEAAQPIPFLGAVSYGLKRFYICHDDRYLYWRADFAGDNPLRHLPPGADSGIFAGVQFYGGFEKNPGDVFVMNESVLRSGTQPLFSFRANHDFSKFVSLDPVTIHDEDDWFEARISLASLRRSCKKTFYVVFVQGNYSDVSGSAWKSNKMVHQFICSVDLSK